VPVSGTRVNFRCVRMTGLGRFPMSISPPAPHPLCLSIILSGCRLSVYRVEQPPLPHRNIWGALIESLRNGLSAPLRRPHMGDAPIIEQKAGSVPQTTDIPHVIDLDRYDESPAAACVAPGISQPKLTKLIREAKVRSINIGRTRLIEKAADVRRMATAAR